MKIFIASLFLPKLHATHAGSRLVFASIKALSRSHDIYLATRVEESERKDIEEIRKYCREMYLFPYGDTRSRGPLTILKIIASYLHFSWRLNGILRRNAFDLVHIEWVETALLLRKIKTPMILTAHDVITKPAERSAAAATGALRLLARQKYRLVRAAELKIMKKFDTVITLSEYDRLYLLKMDDRLPVRSVPVPAGLDITDMKYEKTENSILFLASYKSRPVNVNAALYFYREVFPLVRERIPDALFIAAGYGPPAELTELSAGDPHFIVPGFVDNLDEWYKKAAVFVAPILVGGGIIIKILDALAAGVPTVTTTYGNEGIGARGGRELLVADDPQGFAEAVIQVLTDRDTAARLAENGRRFIREHYSQEAAVDALETLYLDLCGNEN